MTGRSPNSHGGHRLGRRTVASLASLIVYTACGDGTGPGRSDVSVGETIEGTVAGPARTSAFAFEGVEGQTLRVFFQATSGISTDSLVLQVLSPGGSVLTRVASAGNQPRLEDRSGSLFALATTGRYRVEVRGVDTGTDQGPFRFRIAAIDVRPEAAAQSVGIGAVVTGESIGSPGDVDEFIFDGIGGDSIVAFVQGLGASPADSVVLSLRPIENVVFQHGVFAPGVSDSLRAHSTGRAVIPASGKYIVRINARASAVTLPYRFELIRVSSAPERVTQLIPIGTVIEEAIDFRGDRDEFLLDVAAQERLTFRFRRLTRTPDGSMAYQVELLDPAGYRVFTHLQESLETVVTTAPLAAGRYRYRILPAFGGSEPDPGQYRFVVERSSQ